MQGHSLKAMVEMLGGILKRADRKRYERFEGVLDARREIYNRQRTQFEDIKQKYDHTETLNDDDLEWIMSMLEQLFTMCDF